MRHGCVIARALFAPRAAAFEHFEHKIEIPWIVGEAYRVLVRGGVWKFDFPNIFKQVQEFYNRRDEFLMELIYCNRKDIFSQHKWGYTPATIKNYLRDISWSFQFKDVVKHDYPMTGVWATKK